jgi:SAM-dependent methyltransferase
MAFKYEEAVPWGRSFSEYVEMFRLTEADLLKRILGCADGPASFNAQMSRPGRRAVSCDPLYALTVDQIEGRITETYETVISQTKQNKQKFVWERIKSLEELGALRMKAMKEFLQDFEQGKREGRYLDASLPRLPLAAGSFDLALCSHLLFFYSDALSLEFHLQALSELCRVAWEVRIFPLLTYNADRSPYIEPAIEHLRASRKVVSIERVPYEFQRGGNEILRIVQDPMLDVIGSCADGTLSRNIDDELYGPLKVKP